MNVPLVTVIVVTWNSEQDLHDCIGSILRQSYGNFRVKVVDSASSDSTVELLRRKYPEVEVCALAENVGYRRGNQLGMMSSAGDYLVVCNDDVEVEPDWLEKMVERMESNPRIGLVTPCILLHQDRTRINTAGNTVHFSGLYGLRGFGRPAEEFADSEELAAVSGCCFMIRRTALVELEGFSKDFDRLDTRWHASFEDVDLCCRARLAGWLIEYVPGSRMYHKYSRKATTPAMFASYEWGRTLTVTRNYSLRTLGLLIPVFLIFEVLTWFYAAAKGPQWLRGKLSVMQWFLTHPRELMAMRRSIQSRRLVSDRVLLERMNARVRLAHFLPWPAAGRLGEQFFDRFFSIYYSVLIWFQREDCKSF